MHHHTNHCFCTDSNWGGIYHCSNIVSIERIPHGKTYYDPPHEDWVKTTKEIKLLDEITYNVNKSFFKDELPDTQIRKMSMKSAAVINQPVLNWLRTNVKNRKEYEHKQGWCVGSEQYNSSNSALEVSIFFHRRKDALAFIKKWSIYKRSTSYYNHFTDTNKVLNFETMKLEDRHKVEE